MKTASFLKNFFAFAALIFIASAASAQSATSAKFNFGANEFHSKSAAGKLEVKIENYGGSAETLKSLAVPYQHALTISSVTCDGGVCLVAFNIINPSEISLLGRWMNVVHAQEIDFTDQKMTQIDFIRFASKVQ